MEELTTATLLAEEEYLLLHKVLGKVPTVGLVEDLKETISQNFSDVDKHFYQNISQMSFENLCKKYPSITNYLE